MAKKKKQPRAQSAAVSRPQNWFLDIGEKRAEELSRRAEQKGDPPWSLDRVRAYKRLKRISEADYLVRTVLGERDPKTGKRKGGLRDYFVGFDAGDGFDMRHPENLPAKRAATIRKYGAYLHTLQSQPHIKIKPRTKGMRAALQERTGQYLKRHKRYVYHTDKPTVTTVSYRSGVLEEKQKITPQTTILRRYYFFRDYNGGRQPRTFNAMVNITQKKMLREMPDVYYTFWTDLHGSIGAPFPKKSLLHELQRYENKYGTHKGFAEGLLGFVFQGTSDQADSEYINRINRRTRRTQEKSQANQVRQQRLRFLAQARKPRSQRCEVIGRGGRCRLRKGHKGPHRFGEP